MTKFSRAVCLFLNDTPSKECPWQTGQQGAILGVSESLAIDFKKKKKMERWDPLG